MIEWGKNSISWIEERTLYLSIPFTWLLADARLVLQQRSFLWDRAIVGGSAVSLMPAYFDDLPHVAENRI